MISLPKKRKINWKKRYLELWCAVWEASITDFREDNHHETVMEAVERPHERNKIHGLEKVNRTLGFEVDLLTKYKHNNKRLERMVMIYGLSAMFLSLSTIGLAVWVILK